MVSAADVTPRFLWSGNGWGVLSVWGPNSENSRDQEGFPAPLLLFCAHPCSCLLCRRAGRAAALGPPMKRRVCEQLDPVLRIAVEGQDWVLTLSGTGVLKICEASSSPSSLPGAKGKVPALFGPSISEPLCYSDPPPQQRRRG